MRGPRPGRAQDFQSRPLGRDFSLVQQEQPGAERDCLRGTVRDIEDRELLSTLDRTQAVDQGMTIGQVEGGDRFVAQQ